MGGEMERNGKRRELGGAEGRIEREGRLVFAEKGAGHLGKQPTLLRAHFGPHEGQLAIVDPGGGGDEGIAQAGTMDEMDIGSSSERTAVRQACLTEVSQGEDGAPLADACPIQMVLCDSHLGHALGREGDAIIAGKSIGEIKLIESHKDTKRRYYRKETSGEAEETSGGSAEGNKTLPLPKGREREREDY